MILKQLFGRSPYKWDWLQVEVSSLCHAACTYCPTRVYRQEGDNLLMSLDTFMKLSPSLSQTKLVYLQSTTFPYRVCISPSTPAFSSSCSSVSASSSSNRRAIPQSLESSRGVGINFTFSPVFWATFSALSAAVVVWNNTTPWFMMRRSSRQRISFSQYLPG